MDHIELFNKMIEYYEGDPKRIQHFTKVHSYARLIGQLEHLSDDTQNILEIAALVHDIGIKISELKNGNCNGKNQEKEGKAELVCHFCNKKYEFSKEELEQIIKE